MYENGSKIALHSTVLYSLLCSIYFVISHNLFVEQSDYFVERSDYFLDRSHREMEWSDLERSDRVPYKAFKSIDDFIFE